MWDSFAVSSRCFLAGAIAAYHLAGWRQAATGTVDAQRLMAMGTCSRRAALGCWSNPAVLANWAYLDLLVTVIVSYLYTTIITIHTILADLFGALVRIRLCMQPFEVNVLPHVTSSVPLSIMPHSNYLL